MSLFVCLFVCFIAVAPMQNYPLIPLWLAIAHSDRQSEWLLYRLMFASIDSNVNAFATWVGIVQSVSLAVGACAAGITRIAIIIMIITTII